MILYQYRCQSCDEIAEALRAVEDRNRAPKCDECGGATRKIISLSYRVIPDFEPYYDENLQTGIKSKQHRKKVMKEQGVSEAYGKGWT